MKHPDPGDPNDPRDPAVADVTDDPDSDLERRIAARAARNADELKKAKLKLAGLLLAFVGVVLWLWLRA